MSVIIEPSYKAVASMSDFPNFAEYVLMLSAGAQAAIGLY
jgi:hypothetical protein